MWLMNLNVMLVVPILLYSTTVVLVPPLALSCILPLFLFLFCYSTDLFLFPCRCSTWAHNYYFKTICHIITSKSHVWSNESRASFATVRGSFGALSHTLAMACAGGPPDRWRWGWGVPPGKERQGLQGSTEWKLDNRILSVNGHKICVFLKRLSTMTNCVPCVKVFTSIQALFI